MCGLCGLLGEDIHWSNAVTDDLPKRQERLRRIDAINRILSPFHIRVSDVQGQQYLIQGPTGVQELAHGLEQVWDKAQLISGRSLDLLSPEVIEHLERTS